MNVACFVKVPRWPSNEFGEFWVSLDAKGERVTAWVLIVLAPFWVFQNWLWNENWPQGAWKPESLDIFEIAIGWKSQLLCWESLSYHTYQNSQALQSQFRSSDQVTTLHIFKILGTCSRGCDTETLGRADHGSLDSLLRLHFPIRVIISHGR